MIKRAVALTAAVIIWIPCVGSAQTVAPVAPAYSADAPIDFRLTSLAIAQTCSLAIERFKHRSAHVSAVPPAKRSFASVVLPLETIRADLNDALAAPFLLAKASDDASVRAAAQRCANRAAAAQAELDANPALYRAVADANAGTTATTDAARKLSQITLARFRRSGAALSEGKRISFLDFEQQLAELEAAFEARLRAPAKTIAIDGEQAKSLPPDFLATLSRDAANNYLVPVDDARYIRFMSNESDSQARWKFLTTYLQRGGAQNVATLQRAIAVRDRIAHLLGYPSWAAYVLSDRMAGTPARVRAVLDEVTTGLTPIAQAELERMTDRKRTETGDPGAVLESWDQLYYANEVLKRDYAVDPDAIRQYFGLQHTVDATLDLYANLFNVRFAKRDAPEAWSADVVAYDVTDAQSGTPCGTLYLDLFARPGKYPRFTAVAIRPVRRIGATLRPPATAIVGNWPQPSDPQTATLSHDEVVTFFHEMAHAMSQLLSTVPYESLNGYRWDFVEAPGLMFENWAWDSSVLAKLSANVHTGKPLPPATVDTLTASRRFVDTINWLTQVTFARVDLAYHWSGPHVDTSAVWARVFGGTPLPALPQGSIPQAGLAHLMGGYDVGYYGYVWSKVYAQDMFGAFASAGLADSATAQRFRVDVFAPSRTYEPDVLVERFLGRPMNTGAFLHALSAPVRTAKP